MPNVTEIYASLMDDPDIIPPENVSKEDYALLLAKQRVKQYENNEKALNLGLSKLLKYSNGHSNGNGHTSAVDMLSEFLVKADDINQAAQRMLEDFGHSQASIDEIVASLSTDIVPKKAGGRATVTPGHLEQYLNYVPALATPSDEQRVTPEDHRLRMDNRSLRDAGYTQRMIDNMEEGQKTHYLEQVEAGENRKTIEAAEAEANEDQGDRAKASQGEAPKFTSPINTRGRKDVTLISPTREKQFRQHMSEYLKSAGEGIEPDSDEMTELLQQVADKYSTMTGASDIGIDPDSRKPMPVINANNIGGYLSPEYGITQNHPKFGKFRTAGERRQQEKLDAGIARAARERGDQGDSAEQAAPKAPSREAGFRSHEETPYERQQREAAADAAAAADDSSSAAPKDPNAWPSNKTERNAHRQIRDHLIDIHGEEDGEAELQRLIDEEGLGSEGNRPSGRAAGRAYVANNLQEEPDEEQFDAPPSEGAEARKPTNPIGRLRAHLDSLGVKNSRDFINSDNFRDAFQEIYGDDGLDTASQKLHRLIDDFIDEYPDFASLQEDDGSFEGLLNTHQPEDAPESVAEEEEAEEEEEVVEEEEAEEEAEVEEEEDVEEESVAEEQSEEEIDAEVGDNWDTAIDPARAGGIRHALRFGLIDKEGKITPVGKKFFDGVSEMYNDARGAINDNMAGYEDYRTQRGYKQNANPIRDDHRLSAGALLGLISGYNQAVGHGSAGQLHEIHDVSKTGASGKTLLNNDDVTPIEEAIIPNVADMSMGSLNHGHVIDAIISGNEKDSAGEPHWENIQRMHQESVQRNLEDRGIPPAQAEEAVETAKSTVEAATTERGEDLSDEGVQADMFTDLADEAFEVAAKENPEAVQRALPPPSEESWTKNRQSSFFEHLVSDEQAAKWGLAGEAYSGVDGASKLIDQFNQAGIAARAADGASEDKYDIPAPKPEQAEMDLGPEADQPVEREPLDEAGRRQERQQGRQAEMDLEPKEGEQLPLTPTAGPTFEEQGRIDAAAKKDAAEARSRTPEGKREDQLKYAEEKGLLEHILNDPEHDVEFMGDIDRLKEHLTNLPEKDFHKFMGVKAKAKIVADEKNIKNDANEQKENTNKQKEATKNAKDGRDASDGSEVKFDRDKALERLAKARDSDLKDGSPELAQKVKELDDYYDPSVRLTDKELQADLRAATKFNANVESERLKAQKIKDADHAKISAQTRLKHFPSPSEHVQDKEGNPNAEKMSPEMATENAKNMLDFWHQNKEAFKDTEHHENIASKLKEYLDAGADHKAINADLEEMENRGIIGDKEKMEGFREEQKLNAKRAESQNVVHSNKLNEALKNVHADRSTDADGNAVHHRMGYNGELEAVSPEEAGIEHTDPEAPHLGHIGKDGEIDHKAQELYNDLHNTIKDHPHNKVRTQAREYRQAQHKQVAESEATHKETKEIIDSEKDAAHQQNNDSVQQGIKEQVEGHFDNISQLQDDHQKELDQHDSDHQAKQDHLDSLVDDHAKALKTHATQTEATHKAHSERTAAIASQGAKNIKGIASDALALLEEVEANKERAIENQNSQRETAETEIAADRDKKLGQIDEGQRLNNELLQAATDTYKEQRQAATDIYSKASEDSNKALQTIGARHEAERAMLAHPTTGKVDEEAATKLKQEQTAELNKIRETFAEATSTYESKTSELDEAHESKKSEFAKNQLILEVDKQIWNDEHDERRQRIIDAHEEAITKHKQDAKAAEGEVNSTQAARVVETTQQVTADTTEATNQRNKTLGEIDAAKQVVEDGHLESINEERKKRGEEPLTGKQDIQHELQQEKGIASELHEDKYDAAVKAHGEATQTALDEHQAAKQQLGDDHKAKKTQIEEVAASKHQNNNDAHNKNLSDFSAERKKKQAQAEADMEPHDLPVGEEGQQLGFGDLDQGKEEAFKNHMRENGATDGDIHRALANPRLGQTAADSEEEYKNEGEGQHTEEEKRDGAKGQTRMVDDPNNPGEKKQQVWVPGRGKGWVDKDKMDAASGTNMDAAGGKPDGKITVYPQGAKGNPFDGPMAGHGGNWHSIETDNPLASDHPNAAHHGPEDVIAHSLGNSLKDHEGMKGDQPFEVNASDHGFGNSPHGATNKRDPKKTDMKDILSDPKGVARSQVFGEGAQARASDFGEQARAAKEGVRNVARVADWAAGKMGAGDSKPFTGAMDWLKQKASEGAQKASESKFGQGVGQVGQNIGQGAGQIGRDIGGAYREGRADLRRDIDRQGGWNPASGLGEAIGEAMREGRHLRERAAGGKYGAARTGAFDVGFGPDKQGKASAGDEAWRNVPRFLRPKSVKIRHDMEDHAEVASATKKFHNYIDKVREDYTDRKS